MTPKQYMSSVKDLLLPGMRGAGNRLDGIETDIVNKGDRLELEATNTKTGKTFRSRPQWLTEQAIVGSGEFREKFHGASTALVKKAAGHDS